MQFGFLFGEYIPKKDNRVLLSQHDLLPSQPLPPPTLQTLQHPPLLIHPDLVPFNLIRHLQPLAHPPLISLQLNPLYQLIDLNLHIIEVVSGSACAKKYLRNVFIVQLQPLGVNDQRVYLVVGLF